MTPLPLNSQKETQNPPPHTIGQGRQPLLEISESEMPLSHADGTENQVMHEQADVSHNQEREEEEEEEEEIKGRPQRHGSVLGPLQCQVSCSHVRISDTHFYTVCIYMYYIESMGYSEIEISVCPSTPLCMKP